MRAILIAGGNVFAPEDLGVMDVLVVGGKIARIAPHIDVGAVEKVFREVDLVDAEKTLVIPGFVDQHVHMDGGGGEGGPQNRTPETVISEYISGGVTSAIGLLGTDATGRSLESLLMKARSLEEAGISTWILSGSYVMPSATVTGEVARDLIIVDKVIGVKVAISDHRSSHFDVQSLRLLASKARLGGIVSGKAGIVVVHVGAERSGLRPILDSIEGTDIPITQFAPTHLGRSDSLLSEAVVFANMGGYVDFTYRGESTCDVLNYALKQGVPVERITVSSDGHGSYPVFDEKGNLESISMHGLQGISEIFRRSVLKGIVSVSDAVKICATNASHHYGLREKGRLKEGYSGDLLVLEKANYSIRDVVAKGVFLMRTGCILKLDKFRCERGQKEG